MVVELTPQESEVMDLEGVKPFRISRMMYLDMLDGGVITESRRIQLVDGELYEMPLNDNSHWIAVGRLRHLLEGRLPAGWSPISQSGIVTDEYGEPEPDVAIFRGSIMTMTEKATASQTALAIEVSDSTLVFDRGKKQVIYAEAAVPEYWIVNLTERILEIYTEPQPREGERRGTYAVLHKHRADERIAIRVEGQLVVEFAVGDLFI